MFSSSLDVSGSPNRFSLPFFFGQKTRAREPNETVKGGTTHEWKVEDVRNGVVWLNHLLLLSRFTFGFDMFKNLWWDKYLKKLGMLLNPSHCWSLEMGMCSSNYLRNDGLFQGVGNLQVENLLLGFTWIIRCSKYCWWFRKPGQHGQQPVDMVDISFLSRVWPWDFWTIIQ